MKQDELFYVGQKAFIQKEGKVLVLKDRNGNLDFPGGKIQEGETNYNKSIKREVFEETGLNITIGEPFYRWSFIGTQKKHIFAIGFICKYVSGEVCLSKEHTDYKWVSKDAYKELENDSEDFKALEYFFQTYGTR